MLWLKFLHTFVKIFAFLTINLHNMLLNQENNKQNDEQHWEGNFIIRITEFNHFVQKKMEICRMMTDVFV